MEYNQISMVSMIKAQQTAKMFQKISCYGIIKQLEENLQRRILFQTGLTIKNLRTPLIFKLMLLQTKNLHGK
jgi:hypothetical protein